MSFHGFPATILALVALPIVSFPGADVAAQDAVLLTRQEARALALESGPGFLAVAAMGQGTRGPLVRTGSTRIIGRPK